MTKLDDTEVVTALGSSEAGSLAHLYRAEVYRSTTWRQRFDATTNWAVVSTGIALSVSFATTKASALPIVLVGMLTIMFLILEARRYRYFAVWKFRARMIELAIYVPILRGKPISVPQDRGHLLSEDYISPQHRISSRRAIGRRLRRNYGAIFAIQGLAYFAKISIHPDDVSTWAEFFERAHIGPLPGWLALLAGVCFHIIWISLAISTYRQDQADTTAVSDYLRPTRS